MVEAVPEKRSFLVHCSNPSGELVEASIELNEEIAHLLARPRSDIVASF